VAGSPAEVASAAGFDNVTVAEVAEAANVSKMTVFNYFPRKEDLYLDRHADALAQVLTAETGEPTRSRLVAGLLAAAVTTVFGVATARMLDGDDVSDVRRDQARVIDDAFDLLERGIGDYGARQ
jgi:AcrR family transcriptional regulator